MNVNNIRRNKTNINKLDKLIVNVYCKLRKWLTLPENELGNVRLIRTKNSYKITDDYFEIQQVILETEINNDIFI
jgi:hypothetical protein